MYDMFHNGEHNEVTDKGYDKNCGVVMQAPINPHEYRKSMSYDDRHREDRARHMVNPEHAQQMRDDRFNHSMKIDPLSINEYWG